MELFFLLIFFVFIMLNVVIGLVSSRAKKRKAALQRPTEEYAPGAPEPDRGAEASDERGVRGGHAYFLQEQTSDTLVRSMYEEAAERERELHEAVEAMERTQDSYTGPPSIPESMAAIAETKVPLPVDGSGEGEAAAPLEKREPMPYHPGYNPRRLDEQTSREGDRAPSAQLLETPLEEDEGPSLPGSGWEQLKRLPSLQRAVILSEILGPPRALSERTHSHQ